MDTRKIDSDIIALREVAVHLHPQDNVDIAKVNLPVDVTLEHATRTLVRQPIPSGHKVALQEISAGEAVRRYGQVIGFASRTILPGEHVHTHNLDVPGFTQETGRRSPQISADVPSKQSDEISVHQRSPASNGPEDERRTFLGYERAGGRVGTRNYIAVISTVNCSAHASREIVRYFTPERLAAFPNVDGVIALTHLSGCPGRDVLLERTLYERMIDDMDLNAGQVLEGAEMEQVAAELLDLVVTVASGEPSKSESQDVGEAEFCPWNVGSTL